MKSPEMLAARASCGFPRPALSTVTFDVSPPPVDSGGGLSSSPSLSTRGKGLHRRPSPPSAPAGGGWKGAAPWECRAGALPTSPARKPWRGSASEQSLQRQGRKAGPPSLTNTFFVVVYFTRLYIHMVKNSNRTKGCTCKQVFEYILLGALFKECLCTWISGFREGPLWVCVLTDPGRQFPDSSTSADNFSLGFSAPLLSSSSPCFPGRAAPFSARF